MTNEYGNELLHKVLLSAMKDIDKICRENGLRYYLYAGTLLGAINHKGFIPWDDDIDIVMFPEDYKQLCSIIESQYSEKYRMMTFDNTPNWFSKMSKLQVKGANIISRDGEQTPVFVDITVLHSLPDSKYQRTIQRKQIEFINLSLAVLSGAVIPTSWKSKCTFALYAKLGKERLGKKLDRVMTRYDHKATEEVGIMCNTLTRNPYTGVSGYDTDVTKREWHKNAQYIPFEDSSFMTYSNIEDYLTWQYGPHWHEPYPEEKRITKHNVKSYNISEEVLIRIMGDTE